jgi:acylpyruvate hydrolase
MILGTRSRDQRSIAAVQQSGRWYPIDGAADLSELFLDPRWRDRGQAALDTTPLEPAGLTAAAPLPRPGKILCCGLNYRDHIEETGRAVPEHPTLFAKFADTLTGPESDLVIAGSDRIDWEAELAVVVGAELFRAEPDAAAAGILGYTVVNDVSMRDWQSRTLQWLQGKAFDRSTPTGPVVVTADSIDPAAGLRVTCRVNDELVQDGTTDQLVFDSAHLVSYISRFTRLMPGDLVLTGTPGGVGMGMTPPRYLRDGDVLTTAIEGIGELRNRIRVVG